MARGRFETRKKKLFPLYWLLLIALFVSLSAGSVRAYLSMSAEPAQSTLTLAQMPTVRVDGTTVIINSPHCDVYLRVAVVANETADGAIVADKSSYATANDRWTTVNEVVFQYKEKIPQGTTKFILSDHGLTIPSGATVSAQVIQAVGTVDEGTESAKDNAWN